MSKRVPKAYDAVPFTNRVGHVLNPGDPAVAVTTSAGRGNIVYGKYLGMRGMNVVMTVVRKRYRFENEAGEQYDYNLESRELSYPKYPYGGNAADRDAYSIAVNERAIKIQERRKGYKRVEYPYWGYTTLQNNNIYPGDIALRDVKL